MKYIKLFENFFKDMELAAARVHEPVLVDKPKEIQVEKPEPEAEAPKPEEKPAETPQETPETTETTTAAPEEPKTFKDWLATQVQEVVECTDESESNKCWVKLENGTSIQWEISMEDYPSVSVSYKLGEDTVYLNDDVSGDIAREYYESKREYDPKLWAQKCLQIGKAFPAFVRRMEREAINRATDQDDQLSKEFSDLWNK